MNNDINVFKNLTPLQFDSLIKSSQNVGNEEINDEDSPIQIDSMISLQSGRLMFVSSIKIGTLVGLLETEDPRLSIEFRRQRKPDFSRIPEMTEYLHTKPWSYSALTVALSGKFQFKPILRSNGTTTRLGVLQIPRGYKTRAIIIDGQHRFFSLRAALGLEPSYLRYALNYDKQQVLAEENISVIFYVFENDNDGIQWSQQYFHDLNCLGISSSRSLGIKFDKRLPLNRLSVKIADRSTPFIGRIEMEERQCGVRNSKLFTLSALKNANKYLLDEITENNIVKKFDVCLEFWNKLGELFPEWSEYPGYTIREKYIHGYGVILSALGLLGKHIIESSSPNLNLLFKLKSINWSRWETNSEGAIITNPNGDKIGNSFWQGFALNGVTIQNTNSNIRHTSILLRQIIGLPISDEENNLLNLLKGKSVD